jgi:hypothetical protein
MQQRKCHYQESEVKRPRDHMILVITGDPSFPILMPAVVIDSSELGVSVDRQMIINGEATTLIPRDCVLPYNDDLHLQVNSLTSRAADAITSAKTMIDAARSQASPKHRIGF